MTSSNSHPWAAIAWAAMALAMVECVHGGLFGGAMPIGLLGMPGYLGGVAAGTFLPLAIHLGLAYGLLALLVRRGAPEHAVWPGAAALFGLGWHVTLVQEDGIRSMDHYLAIRVGIACALALGLGTFVYILVRGALGSERTRRLLTLAMALLGLVINLEAFLAYRQFHGYLATAICVALAWLLAPYMDRRRLRLGALGCAAALVAIGLSLAPERAMVEGHVRRLSRITGPVLEVLPLTRWGLLETEPLVDPSRPINAAEREEIQRRLEEANGRTVQSAAGRNVVLIVLESTRSDTWADASLTPAFHAWRRHGLYAPTAVAQYPATPLAYGAMFTGQYPSVLAQSPHWGRHRLFDAIQSRFDRLILTRPDINWFDHAAVTAFFLARDTPQHKHSDAADGLQYARRQIEEAREANEAFFAWIHLYEPHAPYEIHGAFPFGDDVRDRYHSEVAYMDQQLGPFMDWLLPGAHGEDTLVLVVGDHGEGLGEEVYGERYVGHHVHVSSVVSHVPFFAAGPGLPVDTIRADLRPAQLDIMPTVFEFLGQPLPTELYVQGVSLQAQLESPEPRPLVTEAFSIRGKRFFDFIASARDQDPARLRAAFRRMNEVNTYPPKIGLEYDNTKIVYDTMLRRLWLYDLVEDPYETRDLAGSEADRAATMRARLEGWRAQQAVVLDAVSRLP